MINSKLCEWARGSVYGYIHNPKTGEKIFEIKRHNIITYAAADIMAKMLGGESAYVPGYMGFVYGTTPTPGTDLVEPPTSRVQTWSGIGAELAGITGNVLISPLAAGPSYAVDGSSSYYANNAVTLTAHSGSRLEYGFPTVSPYQIAFADGDYIYQAMLITRLVSGNTKTYLPFARVSLAETGVYPQKVTGYELALFWQISYF